MKFSEFIQNILPVTNIFGLEDAAGIPRRSLHKYLAHLDGKKGGQRLSWEHIPAIIRALCSVYGCIEIDGWRVTCENFTFFAEKQIQDREVEDSEVGGVFEYNIQVYRNLYSEFDLYNDFFDKED